MNLPPKSKKSTNNSASYWTQRDKFYGTDAIVVLLVLAGLGLQSDVASTGSFIAAGTVAAIAWWSKYTNPSNKKYMKRDETTQQVSKQEYDANVNGE